MRPGVAKTSYARPTSAEDRSRRTARSKSQGSRSASRAGASEGRPVGATTGEVYTARAIWEPRAREKPARSVQAVLGGRDDPPVAGASEMLARMRVGSFQRYQTRDQDGRVEDSDERLQHRHRAGDRVDGGDVAEAQRGERDEAVVPEERHDGVVIRRRSPHKKCARDPLGDQSRNLDEPQANQQVHRAPPAPRRRRGPGAPRADARRSAAPSGTRARARARLNAIGATADVGNRRGDVAELPSKAKSAARTVC